LYSDVVQKQIIDLNQSQSITESMNEKYYKHKLAVNQARMVQRVVAYETHIFLAKEGDNRDVAFLQKITYPAFNSSFIFTGLGKDHIERFIRIMEWSYEETNCKNMICQWKKGEYLRGLDVTLTRDSTDYGVWQINDVFDWCLVPRLKKLYRSGIINFKIANVKTMNDFMDIQTNCVMRCIVEDERKSLGYEWKHDGAKAYRRYIESKIKGLEKEGLYDRDLVNKYYYLTPIKTYTAVK
jgi:hypothetical protein